jgi:hypothetical protein
MIGLLCFVLAILAVAEESAEAVHQDHVEHQRLGGGGVDHALEVRPPVVGGRRAGLDIVGDNREVQCPFAWRR